MNYSYINNLDERIISVQSYYNKHFDNYSNFINSFKMTIVYKLVPLYIDISNKDSIIIQSHLYNLDKIKNELYDLQNNLNKYKMKIYKKNITSINGSININNDHLIQHLKLIFFNLKNIKDTIVYYSENKNIEFDKEIIIIIKYKYLDKFYNDYKSDKTIYISIIQLWFNIGTSTIIIHMKKDDNRVNNPNFIQNFKNIYERLKLLLYMQRIMLIKNIDIISNSDNFRLFKYYNRIRFRKDFTRLYDNVDIYNIYINTYTYKFRHELPKIYFKDENYIYLFKYKSPVINRIKIDNYKINNKKQIGGNYLDVDKFTDIYNSYRFLLQRNYLLQLYMVRYGSSYCKYEVYALYYVRKLGIPIENIYHIIVTSTKISFLNKTKRSYDQNYLISENLEINVSENKDTLFFDLYNIINIEDKLNYISKIKKHITKCTHFVTIFSEPFLYSKDTAAVMATSKDVDIFYKSISELINSLLDNFEDVYITFSNKNFPRCMLIIIGKNNIGKNTNKNNSKIEPNLIKKMFEHFYNKFIMALEFMYFVEFLNTSADLINRALYNIIITVFNEHNYNNNIKFVKTIDKLGIYKKYGCVNV